MSKLTSSNKPLEISKWLLMQAWDKVKVNRGAPGVDAIGVDRFEEHVQDNLYKLWNRMSSGSYFPPPVRMVPIPKADGGTRVLGVPTVADRVAQTAVAMVLEEQVEPIFHPDSYGYRPHRSAIDAVATCRSRCWRNDWVIDLDIKAFFDSVPWELIVKAVRSVCDLDWVMLYVRRWLAAPLQHPDGTLVDRDRGTPQGSAISPVLANLFMHYAFDMWLDREFPAVTFERYADDAVIHCSSQSQAETVLTALKQRMHEVGLELHPDKTRIVYCQDANRQDSFAETGFTFLGYEFRERTVDGRYGLFRSFSPAVSPAALKRMSAQVRSWRLHRWVQGTTHDLADQINPVVRGWMQYYGAFNRSALYPLLKRINAYLIRWLRGKYRRLRRSWSKTMRTWRQGVQFAPTLFAHWQWTTDTAQVW